MTSHPEPVTVNSRKARGPYRMTAGGDLPKRHSEEAIQRLSRKASERGQKLEYMTQTLKRRDARIVELETLLSTASQIANNNSDEEDLLLKELEEANARVERLTNDLQFIQKENEYLRVTVENNHLAIPVSKKKARWRF